MRNRIHENILTLEYGRKVKKYGTKGAAIQTPPETLFFNGMERGEFGFTGNRFLTGIWNGLQVQAGVIVDLLDRVMGINGRQVQLILRAKGS